MRNTVREPKQNRSTETKNKIINASYELFAEVGYYGTNTAEIAKRAGVSTGIVYSYFKDKRDLLLEVLQIYIKDVFNPILQKFEEIKPPIDIDELISSSIDIVIEMHRSYAKIHESLHSMNHTDEAINKKFISLEDEITTTLVDKFKELKIPLSNPYEKIHLAMNIIQSFAHEYIYDNHDYINYEKMKVVVNKVIKEMIVEK